IVSASVLIRIRIRFCILGRMSSVVAAMSAATACANSAGTLAATGEDSRPRKLSGLVRPMTVEREREGSAAKSIQRTNAHRAARYQEIAAPRQFANTWHTQVLPG